MAIEIIILPDEGRIQGCNCRSKGTKNIQKLRALLPLLWLNAFLLGNQIHNSLLLLVCPNNAWVVTYKVKLEAEVFACWGNQQQGEHPMPMATLFTCATINGGAKDVSMDAACKVQSAHDSNNSCLRC